MGGELAAPDYLVIGHVCQDVIVQPGSIPLRSALRPGGTVTFAARTARAFDLNVAVVTSAAPDFDLSAALPEIAIHRLPSTLTTTFENQYQDGNRRQLLHAVAAPIGLADVPPAWKRSAIIHLGPVAQEVDPALMQCFPGAFVGVTPQGWLRRWDEHGRVHPCVWQEAQQWLPHLSAIVLSIEDVGGDEALVAAWARQARVLVVTRGAHGATLYVDSTPQHIPAPQVVEVDPTGAGDIFAAAFFIHLHRTQDPLLAAHLATRLAADSVTRAGLDGIPRREHLARSIRLKCKSD